MLAQVHEHIVEELQQGARTDTVFVVTAVAFNLVVLAVNSAVATAGSSESDHFVFDMVLVIFIIMSLLVNLISISALSTGRSTRSKLLGGLLRMYGDEHVDTYYDASLLTNYGRRYLLFMGVVLSLAATGILVPLVIRFAG